MSRITLHWSPIPLDLALPQVGEGRILFALWPAPVNPDACFEAAGFGDFGDSDDAWEVEAAALLDRLIATLSRHGEGRLLSQPLRPSRPWYRRVFSRPQPLPLRQQIEMPLEWDSLPDCLVAFGDQGITLGTGKGHHLFWIGWPAADAGGFPVLLEAVGAGLPRMKTDLKWACLL